MHEEKLKIKNQQTDSPLALESKEQHISRKAIKGTTRIEIQLAGVKDCNREVILELVQLTRSKRKNKRWATLIEDSPFR